MTISIIGNRKVSDKLNVLKILQSGLHDASVQLLLMQGAHITGLHLAGRYPEIWRWTTQPYCLSIESTTDWVNQSLEMAKNGSLYPMVIIDKCTGEIVGATTFLNIALEHKSIEIGYTFLSPSAQQTGINRRVKLLLLNHAFSILGCNRVAFQTHESNMQSRSAIEALGATFEGVLRNCRVQHDGSIRSSAVYSILCEEWSQAKRKITNKISVNESTLSTK